MALLAHVTFLSLTAIEALPDELTFITRTLIVLLLFSRLTLEAAGPIPYVRVRAPNTIALLGIRHVSSRTLFTLLSNA
jgi:hypothetical protein